MRRGGGALRSLAAQESRQDETPPPAPETNRPTGLSRGRGRFISQMMAQRGGDERLDPSTVHTGARSESSSSESGQRLSRQGSDLSRSSVVSQQFAQVENRPLFKAEPQKDPTTSGSPITVSLNYMTFNVAPGTSIEAYHVNFNPDIESIRLRYSLLRSEASRAIIGNVMHWTGTNLYLPHRLEDNETIFETTHPVTGNAVRITIKYVKRPPTEELLQFYNSLMHKLMSKMRYVVINRQHYSPLHRIHIEQHKLEVWPGWLTSVQRLDGGLKLSVDATFRVLRLETVRDIMIDINNRSRGTNLKEAFEAELKNSIIMTRYNNKSYRIDGIDLTKKPTDTFKMTRGGEREISYVDYMRQHWSIEVRDHNQPLLVHKPKPRRGQEAESSDEVLYLIPELCVTTGLTDEMRTNFQIMKAIGDHTRLPPEVRESKLTDFLRQIATDETAKSVLGDWNLSVRPELDVVEGRRLDNESVIFGNNRSFKVPDKADWTGPATQSNVLKSVDINEWVLFVTERDANIAQDFLNCVKEVSRNLGIKFSAPRVIKLPNDSPTTYINYGKREVKRTDQMVVIMTPGRSQREDRYSACKRLYSCELPIPCQFIRCGTVSNPQKLRSVCQKIVIQILGKVGGQPWGMRFPMKSFMIVGIDVYHDTIDRKRSCLGFVASMNEFTSTWWSHTFFQHELEEIGQKLNTTMISAIRKYHAINGFIPQRIIVYRDGVGDGQFPTVLDFEIPQVMAGIDFYLRDGHSDGCKPQVSYIIVQKRINAKLGLRQEGRTLNPPPGSYVDHTITHPKYNDFYLVSQHVNQGTVSPTKYVLLTETGTLKMEHHQKLAYKMTHMYFNWCGTIRVPAPCQYAHKLAYLCGQNIRQQPSERLEDKLYYL